MNSYRFALYSKRPNKSIERSMIAELLNKFTKLIRKGVNYIGFGSLECVDFVLFNKKCNIKRMITIEDMDFNINIGNEDKSKRFLFNKPLKEIELIPKNIVDSFDDIPFNENALFWYDFDNDYSTEKIEIISETIKRCEKTSMIAISTTTLLPSAFKVDRNFDGALAKEQLKKYIGRKKYPDFDYNNFRDYYKEIIDDYYLKVLKNNNKKTGRNFVLRKIAHYLYADTSKIDTTVYVLIDADKYDPDKFFAKMMKCPSSGEHTIFNNYLTKKEKQYINRNIHKGLDYIREHIGLDEEDVKVYLFNKKYE